MLIVFLYLHSKFKHIYSYTYLLDIRMQNSVNARDSKIPFPWLAFNEKIKVNSVFLRDSTAISDSVLLLFGGSISKGNMVSSPLSVILQDYLKMRIHVKAPWPHV